MIPTVRKAILQKSKRTLRSSYIKRQYNRGVPEKLPLRGNKSSDRCRARPRSRAREQNTEQAGVEGGRTKDGKQERAGFIAFIQLEANVSRINFKQLLMIKNTVNDLSLRRIQKSREQTEVDVHEEMLRAVWPYPL